MLEYYAHIVQEDSLAINHYVGMCILDLSKTLMYDFHYNYIKKKYNDRAKLLFTDTDSLTYEIETVDAYKDLWTDKDMFDNSDYPENSPYYCNSCRLWHGSRVVILKIEKSQ